MNNPRMTRINANSDLPVVAMAKYLTEGNGGSEEERGDGGVRWQSSYGISDNKFSANESRMRARLQTGSGGYRRENTQQNI